MTIAKQKMAISLAAGVGMFQDDPELLEAATKYLREHHVDR